MKLLWSQVGILISSLSLVGCGVIYTSPQVRNNDTAIVSVQVIPFSVESIAQANRSEFVPRSLPSAYSTIANIGTANSQIGLPIPPLGVEQPSRRPDERLPPAVTRSPYKLGVGDRVRIVGPSIIQQTDRFSAGNASQTFAVQSGGNLVLPDIGTLDVGGLTLEEANQELVESLVENRLDPNFTLEIAEFNARRVLVDGAVNSAVAVPITFEPLSLRSAIVAAGGAQVAEQQFATARILRNGELYSVPLDLLYGPSGPQVLLVDGDAVFVDSGYDLEAAKDFFRSTVKRRQLTSQLRRDAIAEIDALANLQRNNLDERRDVFERRLELGAIGRDYIFLVGEVGQTRAVPLPFEQTISLSNVLFSDVSLPIETADLSHIYVVRIAPDATFVHAYHLDGTNAINLTFAAHFEMRPNDLVFVAEQRVTAWNRVLSQLSPTFLTSVANGN